MDQNRIKNRMKLKRLALKVQKEVDENFGYCPSNEYFDRILDERNKISQIIRENDSEWYKIYEEFEYRERVDKLQIF